jgi:tetratricopeptide (TPR) repeat protein
MVLVPLALVLPLLGAILLVWGNAAFDRLLITKVQSDLAVARGYFDRVLVEVGASAGAVADSHALHLALDAKPRGDLVALLRGFKAREGLDFINLRGADGTLLFNLAILVEDLKRPAEAADLYRAALEETPDLPDAHYNLALLCEAAGERQEAIRHLAAYRKLSRS